MDMERRQGANYEARNTQKAFPSQTLQTILWLQQQDTNKDHRQKMSAHPTRRFKSGRETARKHQASTQRLCRMLANDGEKRESIQTRAPGLRADESTEFVISAATISSRRSAFSGKLVEKLIALIGQSLNHGDYGRTREYAERLLHLCSSKGRSFSSAGVYLAQFALAHCCNSQKDHQQALRHTIQACKIALADSQLMHVRGTTFRLKAVIEYTLRKLEGAAESISTAIFYFGVENEQEELLAAQSFLATIYAAQNKFVEAELALQPLVDLQRPQTPEQKVESTTWERNYELICEQLAYENSVSISQQSAPSSIKLA